MIKHIAHFFIHEIKSAHLLTPKAYLLNKQA